MSKTRDKYISMRVDESIYNEVKKRAESAGQTVSDYMLGVVEDMIDGDKDLILLLRNTYEEVLKLGDMLSLVMGFNTDAYATIISRISVDMTDAQLKASKERRESVLKGLRKYLRENNERLNEGAIMRGSMKVQMSGSEKLLL